MSPIDTNHTADSKLASRFSFLVLVAAVVGAGILFYRVVEPFLFPLFFAGVLALLFWPLHKWTEERLCGGRRRISAVLLTTGIMLLVMLPISGALFLSARELIDVGRETLEWLEPSPQSDADLQVAKLRKVLTAQQFEEVVQAAQQGRELTSALPGSQGTEAGVILEKLEQEHARDDVQAALESRAGTPLSRIGHHPAVKRMRQWVEPMLTTEDFNRLREAALKGLEGVPQAIYARTTALVGNTVYFVIGTAVLIVALYYFFVDGPGFLQRLQRLSPLDDDDEVVLFTRFQRVCRGVVLATIVSAFVQAVLATIGFSIAGMERPILLGIVTLFFAMVPFIGAAGVWAPVALYLLLQQHYIAGILLGIYGALVVSLSDNVVKIFVIQGQGRMHPLVVFVTMLGALRVIGLWGIFVGPLVAAVFYALLTLLHRHLEGDDVELA